MDVDIDHLREIWSNGYGYRPVLEQWIWICAVSGAMDLEEWIYGGRVRMAGYTAGIGHAYILLIPAPETSITMP